MSAISGTTQPFRTRSGGRIDRGRPLRFRFDGTAYQGHAGDTLASALLANGVHLVGRSFKYHRPRGILSAGSEEPNALVGVCRRGDQTPNLRATQVELYEGLAAISQNRFPSLGFDVGAVNDWLSPLFPAGFYYKTFMWPRRFWDRVYEPMIRAAAGLGKAPKTPDADRYANLYAHCDVLVIGAGPAGLAAALAASDSGARVILCDEQAEFGGSLLAETAGTIEGKAPADWVRDTVATLAARGGVTLLARTTAFGYFAQNFVALAERVTDHLADPDPALPRERLWQVRAREVVIAAGALERPLVFPDNDRPGILLAEAGRTYLNRYGVRPGRSVLVATACDSAWTAAFDLADAGVSVAAIADLRAAPPEALVAAARERGLRVETACVVTGTRGRLRVSGALLGRLRADGTVAAAGELACDALLMSGGWTPTVSLHSQSRGKVAWDDAAGAFLPGASAQRARSAGACRGVFGLAATLDDGYAAGEQAAEAATGAAPRTKPIRAAGAHAGTGGTLGALPHDRDAGRVKAFVDFQNDVTAKDVRLAVREGLHSIEHIKRYTTTGMATDQGRLSNLNALAIAAEALGRPIPEVGLTTFRLPYTPTTFGTFAGASRGILFDPERRTPSHARAEAAGAVFEDVGQWKRARYFPQEGEDMPAAVARECATVRRAVGVFDASTLGKIEVVGPDAATFLERMYTNPFKGLKPGRCRYALMLNEAGFVIDDGVVGRLADDRFHVTTTTGGAARVFAAMEDYRQTEWPDLDVWITSTTEQWAVIAVQGPLARETIAPFVAGIDLAPDALPHMSVAAGRFSGLPCRLFRVSFTGELGFEVNVPARHGAAVWDALCHAAERRGGCAYGTEAMHVLRAEKGYIIVGQETDGTVTPADLGLEWAIGKAKPDFVGKRSLARPDLAAAGRKQLVGLLTEDPARVLEEGAQVTLEAEPARGTPARGHVTSAYWSPAAGRSIALALVEDGRARTGETLHVPMPAGALRVRVVEPVFHDPQGEQLHG
ncbi:sarcosine oxidase subunit alpha family protein [Polymorphum gilvum]|uniref:Putative sarcosine oxidase alpha subunit transmembrane protein n=1 Tax=Polymorphum gilvum (strain LMG 25793 / CGMCC 1.9160 / SL003B-26A1) TaxID=991905 RepID=F2IWQ1_POLGS|nr:sarcosine oxidase subunit alpha family protein [Polymorphum gilvum]ADZ70376.1 Putative sarcosine oxidase alpha subunit transmembrane protein [Polymorphum gilvum SL003B-26A1]